MTLPKIDFSKLKESQPSISAEEFLKEKGIEDCMISKKHETDIKNIVWASSLSKLLTEYLQRH